MTIRVVSSVRNMSFTDCMSVLWLAQSILFGNGLEMHVQKSAEVIVAVWDVTAKDRTEHGVLHLKGSVVINAAEKFVRLF